MKQKQQANPAGGVEFSGSGLTLTSEFPDGLPQGRNGIPEIIVTPCGLPQGAGDREITYYWHTDLKNALLNPKKYLFSVPPGWDAWYAGHQYHIDLYSKDFKLNQLGQIRNLTLQKRRKRSKKKKSKSRRFSRRKKTQKKGKK